MKYLLISLYLFTTHSFSDEFEIKGLTCNKIEESNLNKYTAYYFKKNKKVKIYKLRKINGEIKIENLNVLKYKKDPNFITIYTNYSFYKINIKTLELISNKNIKCKSYNSLLKVFKQMKAYVQKEQKKHDLLINKN